MLLVFLIGACAGEDEVEPSPTSLPFSSTTATISATTTTLSTGTTTARTTTTTEGVNLGPELVGNGDFSVGIGSGSPTGWELNAPGDGQRADRATESEESHVSFFSPLGGTDQWPEASSQPFPVLPHRDYRLMAEGRTFTDGSLFLALVFLDEDGDEILLRGIGSPAIGTSDWTRVEGTIESPATAVSAYVVVGLPVVSEATDGDSLSVDVNMVSVQEVMGP